MTVEGGGGFGVAVTPVQRILTGESFVLGWHVYPLDRYSGTFMVLMNLPSVMLLIGTTF